MNNGFIYRDEVAAGFEGLSILDFYSAAWPRTSRSEWAQRISLGLVRLNGEVVAADAVVRTGDRLAYHRPPWEEPRVPADIPVVYEDEDLLVVNKPDRLPVLPGGGYLENTAIHILRRRYGDKPLHPIHRLGRGTTGLLIFGKNRAALSALGKALKEQTIDRRYLGVMTGLVERDSFSEETPIGLIEHPRIGPVHAATADGRPSRTDFRILDRCDSSKTTLAEIALHSGRTHQIRIHAAVAGHPLVGDPFYIAGGRWDEAAAAGAGKVPVPGDSGYLLHAWRVTFQHPRNGAPLDLICPPPTTLWPRPIALVEKHKNK